MTTDDVRGDVSAEQADDDAMSTSYFDSMYANTVDPWGFDSSWYEQRKYDVSLALLPHQRFRRALEPGCSNGSFTERLAERCDALIAFDFMDDPVDRARERLADRRHVEVRRETFPSFWPDGTGDLVVWSEVAYYLNDRGAERAIDGLSSWLEPGGTLLSVHYTGSTNYPRPGHEISRWLDTVSWLRRTALLLDDGFEAGIWERRHRDDVITDSAGQDHPGVGQPGMDRRATG